MKTFDPYNFDYKSYVKETYDLNEMPNKYHRGEYQNDDPILNSQDAIWVEKNGKNIGNYKMGSFNHRFFVHVDGNDTTYYLLSENKPFIIMEYSFTRITSPIKGIENKHLWNFKGDKGTARMFFDEYILKQEPIIVSDKSQTEKGFNFWKYLWREHVTDKKTHTMYVVNINDGKIVGSIENEQQMNDFYTTTKSGNLRFVLQKI
jgi:hypothetical protein